MNSKNSIGWIVLSLIICLIGIYINFQYPFMHYMILGLLYIGLAFISLLVIWYLIDSLKSKIKKRKANSIISSFPQGYTVWLRNNRGLWRNDSKIIESEEIIKKYQQYYPQFEEWQEWGKKQSNYCNTCRDSMNNNTHEYGYYYYSFNASHPNELGNNIITKYPLWHFFIYAYSSFAKFDDFTNNHFKYIIDNNTCVNNIICNNYDFSSDNNKLIKFLNLLYSNCPNLLVLCFVPEIVTEKDSFYNHYYHPISEAFPSISFYQINSYYQLYDKQIDSKYVVILECYTEYNRQIKVAEHLLSYYGSKSPYLVFVSLYKEYSNDELQKLIDEKKEEIRRENEIKESIVSLIDHGHNLVKRAQIEKAGEVFKEAEKAIEEYKLSSTLVTDLNEHLEDIKLKSREIYKKIETYEEWNEETIVNYSAPQDFIQSKEWMYAVAKFPQKGCHVYPARRGAKSFRVGHIEKDLYSFLLSILDNKIINIRKDIYLIMSENNVRETDIALEINGYPIKIDIEIDEPYEAGNRKPIHYITCGDDSRDDEFIRRGWIVVRFSEKQAKLYPKSCASYLALLLKALVPEIGIPEELKNVEPLPKERRWTWNDALKMAANKERERYLNHSFCVRQKEKVKVDFELNENEKRCNDLIEKPEIDKDFLEKMESFTDAELYDQDKYIAFEPFEHIYRNKKNEEHFLPVSTLIAYFFEGFDALKQAEMQWDRYGIPIEESLNKWDKIGKKASEVGTFVHLQTENYFNNGYFESEYTFEFNGEVELINVEREKRHFLQFVNDYMIHPYRQEWSIYDSKLNVAGTVDLICKNENDTFTIYDWKRSGKVVNYLGQPIVEAYGGKTSYHGINLPDTAYYHYCIQQNLYRYILEKNYHIKVSKLNLVVLWPENKSYYVVNVPIMDRTIEQIVSICHERDLGHQLLN